MADAKKKKAPSILPGNSPWERRALKSGNAMTPIQVQMHKAFVSGKKEAKSMAASGNYKQFSTANVAAVKKNTTKAGAANRVTVKPSDAGYGKTTIKEQRVMSAQGLGKMVKANKIYKKKFSAK
jgi:hypothetical protein